MKKKSLSEKLSAGTPFQKKVWRAIAAIPRGQVRTYSQIAKKIGRPNAARAVANACGANPAPITVPCHRVVASDGSLGGYSYGGLVKKRKLLTAEGIKINQGRIINF